MPKIVINEYDKTKAGVGEYANFSVVVPGYLSDKADETVFDENGVYECSSQTDFVNNIGKRAAEIVTRTGKAGTGPVVDLTIRYKENATEEELAGIVDDGKIIEIYYKDRTKFEEAFVALCNNNFIHKVGEETKLELTSADYKLYTGAANATKKPVGVLVANDMIYSEVIRTESDAAAIPTVVDDNDGMGTMEIKGVVDATEDVYFVIRDSAVGEDGQYIEDRITHYGNQMAYELLGLGYTVLYKKMTEYTETELEDLGEEEGSFKTENNIRVINAEKSKAIVELEDPNFWECLRDKSTYDFRYIVTGLLTNNDGANTAILSIADIPQEIALDDADGTKDGRGDCIALIDLDCTAYAGKTQKAAVPCIAQEAAKFASVYAAVFAPYVEYIMAEDEAYDNNCVFPGSFHYLACAANSSSRDYAEWYANAGLSRGVAKYTVKTTGCKLGEVAIQALEPRFILPIGKDSDGETINTTVAVNLIVNIKGSYYLWGNRTAKKLGARGSSEGDLTAQNFLNVRQLCSTIKKQVYVTCRRLTFDPNSNMLWINFRSLIKPTLEKMKADQGIKDYKFVKNETDRKALLSAKIRIVPIEAVEDFEIGLYLEDNLEDVVVTEA
jgi:hypothetical protein